MMQPTLGPAVWPPPDPHQPHILCIKECFHVKRSSWETIGWRVTFAGAYATWKAAVMAQRARKGANDA